MLNENELVQARRALDYYLANFDLTTMEKMDANRAYDKLGGFIDGDKVAIIWSKEDAQELDSELNDGQARAVLSNFKKHHEGSMEQMWLDLQYHVDNFKEQEVGA